MVITRHLAQSSVGGNGHRWTRFINSVFDNVYRSTQSPAYSRRQYPSIDTFHNFSWQTTHIDDPPPPSSIMEAM